MLVPAGLKVEQQKKLALIMGVSYWVVGDMKTY